MSGPTAAAELAKLARQLDVPVGRLDFLAAVPAADLGLLRSQIGEALLQADRHHFTRIAALSAIVPVPVSARISEIALPPLLAARTSELLDPQRAAEMVARLSVDYLSRVAAAMDPGRSAHVIARIPADKVAAVGAELALREEWVVIGGFISVVSGPALREAIAGLDGEQLLRIAVVLHDPDRLNEVGDLLSQRQLDQLLAAAAAHELWLELDQLLGELADRHAARLAGRFGVASVAVRAAITAAHERGDLSDAGFARVAPD